jgi:hypothetical protein
VQVYHIALAKIKEISFLTPIFLLMKVIAGDSFFVGNVAIKILEIETKEKGRVVSQINLARVQFAG